VRPLRGREPEASRTGQARDVRLPRLHAHVHAEPKGAFRRAAEDHAQAAAGEAARGEDRAAASHAPTHPRTGRLPARRPRRAHAVLRCARQQRVTGGIPAPVDVAVAARPEPTWWPSPRLLGAVQPQARPVAPEPAHLPSLAGEATWRHY